MFVIELGTNCYARTNHDWFVQRVENVLNTHNRICPQKPLLLIDMFRVNNEADCSRVVKENISEKALNNEYYISGHDILDAPKLYASDLVHPSIEGHQLIAQSLSEIIKQILK